MAVLSPARVDLADGTRVRIDSSQAKRAAPPPDASSDSTPDQDTAPSSSPGTVAAATTEPDNAVISAAISAHIDSVVNDARRNVTKYGANR